MREVTNILKDIKNINDLKKLGRFSEVKKQIKEYIMYKYTEIPFIDVKSWNDLFAYITLLNQIIIKSPENYAIKNSDVNETYKSKFFISKEAEYIYYLVKLDGEEQVEKLKIKEMYFKNQEAARRWRNDIVKYIHPDKCNHPDAEKAIEKLTNLYEKMVKWKMVK